MKKLMLTTAIASVLTTAAIAQTSITGELRINYKDVTMKKWTPANLLGSNTATGTQDSSFGFGAEQQINIQTKGKLNVLGLDYAAGFAIENDGEQTGTLFNENVYFDLTNASSGTTLSIGRDHIQRSDSDRSATNLVGFTPNELSQILNQETNGTWFAQNLGPAVSQRYGVALLQKTPVGTFSYNWVPNNPKNATPGVPTAGAVIGNQLSDQITVTSPNNANVASSEAVNPQTTTAYEYGFVGDLGVKGLEIHYFKSANNDLGATYGNGAVKAEAKNYGVKYNFGDFTVGANKKVYNGEAATLTEYTEKAYAVAYAVNKDLSIGLLKATADDNLSTTTEKMGVKAVNLGYNLGPVALAAGYSKVSDAQGISGADNNVFMVRLLGAF